MAEVHLELSQHIAKAGLQDALVQARPTSQGRDTLVAAHHHELCFLQLGLEEWR